MKEDLGKLLKEARESKGFSQEELANKISVSSKAISKWENNKGKPGFGYIVPLAKELDLNPRDILLGYKSNEINNDVFNERNNNYKKYKRIVYLFSLLFMIGFCILLEIIFLKSNVNGYYANLFFILIIIVLGFIESTYNLEKNYIYNNKRKTVINILFIVIMFLLLVGLYFFILI